MWLYKRCTASIYSKYFEYIIDTSLDSFNLIHIFECGQCFRWEKQDDESYIGVIKDTVVNVKIIDRKVHLKGVTLMNNVEEYLREYFDITVFFYNPNISSSTL